MNLQKLTQLNELARKIEQKKEQIAIFEGARIVGIDFRRLDYKMSKAVDYRIENNELPCGVIKNAVLDKLKFELNHLQGQFENFEKVGEILNSFPNEFFEKVA